MKRIILLGLSLLVITFVSFSRAQNNKPQSVFGTEPTTSSFRSTGTLMGSGSAYASTPMLNADGTAAAPYASSGPRRAAKSEGDDEIVIVTPGQGGSQAPIGDAALPLMLLALAYATALIIRRRSARP